MPAMLSKLYHALLGAGVDDATATAAAEEAAQSDQRFAALEVRMERLEGQIGRTLDAVKALSERMDSHFRIVYWTLGVLVAAFLGLAWRVLS